VLLKPDNEKIQDSQAAEKSMAICTRTPAKADPSTNELQELFVFSLPSLSVLVSEINPDAGVTVSCCYQMHVTNLKYYRPPRSNTHAASQQKRRWQTDLQYSLPEPSAFLFLF